MTKTVRIILPTLVLILCSFTLASDHEVHSTGPTEAQLRAGIRFAGEVLGLQTGHIPLPKIRYLSHTEINRISYGQRLMKDVARGRSRVWPIVAFYKDGLLTLDKDMDFSDPDLGYLLAHEMTHHVQFFYRMDAKLPCIHAMEPDAYKVGNLWTLATGYGRYVGPLYIHQRSECPR